MWLQASGTNEKLKQDTQTNVADALQAMPVLHVTQLEAIRQHY